MKFVALLILFCTVVVVADEEVSITTKHGRTFEGKITRIEASGIVLMHSAGVARIDFEDLTGEDQEKYGYSPDRAAAERKAMAASIEARRQALIAQREAAEAKRAHAELLASAEKNTFQVISVIPGQGVVAALYRRGRMEGSAASAVSAISGRASTYIPPSTGDTVFVTGEIGVVVDDDIFEAVVVPDGTHQYETVIGSLATVKKYRVLQSKIDR